MRDTSWRLGTPPGLSFSPSRYQMLHGQPQPQASTLHPERHSLGAATTDSNGLHHAWGMQQPAPASLGLADTAIPELTTRSRHFSDAPALHHQQGEGMHVGALWVPHRVPTDAIASGAEASSSSFTGEEAAAVHASLAALGLGEDDEPSHLPSFRRQ